MIFTIFFNHIPLGILFSLIAQNTTVIHQSVVYQCTVDSLQVSVSWSVNESESSSYYTSLGIITQGIDTQNSTLTIPGEVVLNETKVTCIASGVVNEKQYHNASSVTLYIQGEVALC